MMQKKPLEKNLTTTNLVVLFILCISRFNVTKVLIERLRKVHFNGKNFQLYVIFKIYSSSNFDEVPFKMVNSKRLWLYRASVYKQNVFGIIYIFKVVG